MASQGIIGFGSTFSIGGNTIAEITNITPMSASGVAADTTSMDSTDAAKTFIPGTIDYGSVSFEMIFDGPELNTLQGLWRTVSACVITLSDGATFTFDGFLVGLSVISAFDDAVRASVEIKITGAVTFTP